MILEASKDTTSVSVEGRMYPVRDGLVELPDDLPGPSIKHLIESHAMRVVEAPVEAPAAEAKSGGKGR